MYFFTAKLWKASQNEMPLLWQECILWSLLLLWLGCSLKCIFGRRQGRLREKSIGVLATPGNFSINRTEELRSEEMHGELCGSVAISVVNNLSWAPCTLWFFYTFRFGLDRACKGLIKRSRKSTRCLCWVIRNQIHVKNSRSAVRMSVCCSAGRSFNSLLIMFASVVRKSPSSHLWQFLPKVLQILFVEDNASLMLLSRFASAFGRRKILIVAM